MSPKSIANLPKIDIHCHTTNRPVANAPAADLTSIVGHMNGHNITKTVLLATYFPKRGSGISNFRMLNWIENHEHSSRFIMFGSLDFEHYFFQGVNELTELADRKLIAGIKIYSGYQNIKAGKLESVVKIAQQYKLPVMFHTGDCIYSDNVYSDVTKYEPLLSKYADVNFVYTHLCNPAVEQLLLLVKRYPNLYTDISGLIHSAHDRHEIPAMINNIKRYHAAHGCSQLLFGTDFPIQTHQDTVDMADKALGGVASDEELDLFCFKNAAKLLGL
jgi:predicted TIM-barrel fold metal-dependent hydrolase